MFIGIVYDAFNNNLWHSTEKSIDEVKKSLDKFDGKLPLACIYDASSGRFVEFNNAYQPHIGHFYKLIESVIKSKNRMGTTPSGQTNL